MWPMYFVAPSTLFLLLIMGVSESFGERRHIRGRETYEELCLGQGTLPFRNLDPRYSYNIAGIYSPQSWIHAGRKSTVELFCRVCGVADNCQYTVRWSKDGETLSHRKSSRIHAYVLSKSKHLYGLRIQNFRSKDYGLYSCTYYTSTGDELETQIQVSGIALPAELSPPSFNSPNSVTLNWKVNCSTPIINYELEFRDYSREGEKGPWIVMNIPAKNKKVFAKSQSYRLNGLLHKTTYQARVRSRNVFGLSDYSPILKFHTLKSEEEEEEKESSPPSSRRMQADGGAIEDVLFKRSDILSNSVLAQEELNHPDGEPLKTKQSRGYAAYSNGVQMLPMTTTVSLLLPLFLHVFLNADR